MASGSADGLAVRAPNQPHHASAGDPGYESLTRRQNFATASVVLIQVKIASSYAVSSTTPSEPIKLHKHC